MSNCTRCQEPILTGHGKKKYCSKCMCDVLVERTREAYHKRKSRLEQAKANVT